MANVLRFIRNAMGVLGFMLIFGYVGTCDYYLNELGQAEPEWLERNFIIGIILVIPVMIRWVQLMLGDNKNV